MFYHRLVTPAYAELHCHTDFSFLDGASPADDLVERALELGLSGLAVTDHQGLYGAVRFSAAAREAGLHAVVGMEVELVDAAVAGPGRPSCCQPRRARGRRAARRPSGSEAAPRPGQGSRSRAVRPRQRPPGHREPRREDLRGVRARELGPHLTLLAAGPGRLHQPLPAGQRRAPGRQQGRASLQPRPARRAQRGPHRPHGLSPRRALAPAPGR